MSNYRGHLRPILDVRHNRLVKVSSYCTHSAPSMLCLNVLERRRQASHKNLSRLQEREPQLLNTSSEAFALPLPRILPTRFIRSSRQGILNFRRLFAARENALGSYIALAGVN